MPGEVGAFHGSRDFPHGTGVESISLVISPQEGVSRASSVITAKEQPTGLSDSFARPGLLRKGRKHARQMWVCVTNPFPFRSDAEQMLGDDQAEQLNVVENGLTTRVVIPRKAERGRTRSSRWTNSAVRRVLRSVFTHRVQHPPPSINSLHAAKPRIGLTHLVAALRRSSREIVPGSRPIRSPLPPHTHWLLYLFLPHRTPP